MGWEVVSGIAKGFSWGRGGGLFQVLLLSFVPYTIGNNFAFGKETDCIQTPVHSGGSRP